MDGVWVGAEEVREEVQLQGGLQDFVAFLLGPQQQIEDVLESLGGFD